MSKKPSKKPAKKPSKAAPKPAAKAAQKPAKKAAAKPLRKAAATVEAKPTRTLGPRVVTLLKFARKMVDDAIAGIPDDRCCEQMAGAPNHKMWTMGHLAVSNAWFGSLLTGKMGDVPETYNAKFGMGSTPSPDAAAYPSLDEVRGYYRSTFDAILAAAEGLDDTAIVAPCAADTGGFASDKLDGLLKTAWHEGWHLGQMSMLRRAMGVSPLMPATTA